MKNKHNYNLALIHFFYITVNGVRLKQEELTIIPEAQHFT